jgi:distribution and morphology protein 10
MLRSHLTVATTDYLLYGRIYIPTGKLDALYSTRISPTMQAMVAAISEPPSKGHGTSNVMFSLQHDTGRTCTEYSWSAEDSMWGVRVLHNFGKLGMPADEEHDRVLHAPGAKPKRVDEEDAMEGGLKGRIAAGAEVYLSAKERSAGSTLQPIFDLGSILKPFN